MYDKEFGLRLAQLRNLKGVSARDMSLSLGQNHSYINTIESGRALPSLSGFFYICEYLEISPADFFAADSSYPKELNDLIENLKKLDGAQLDNIASLVSGLVKNKS